MTAKDKPLQQLSSNAVSAKELAKSLGLVTKRPSSSSTSRAKGHQKDFKSSQYFAYLVVLDFESTCWKDKKMSYGPEIIEFPAVLLNTSTGELESEFHMFVQPSEHSKLSEFCTELTGITQTQVDEGVPVGTCLMLFGRWLQEIKDRKCFKFPCDQVQKNTDNEAGSVENSFKWCTFVTWSDWDLGTCLKNECHRKQLRMPHPLRSWIDLRATYKNFYSRKPQGLAGALQDLGIKFSGREHSGLDDARNTARLAWRMISDGCIMQITKSIDGMVENLWNIVTKSGHSQSDSRNTNTNSKDLPGRKDLPERQTKLQIVPSATEATSLQEGLNFARAQTGNHGGLGVQQNSAAKRNITGTGDGGPCEKMTKIKDRVKGIQVNGDITKENHQVGVNLKRRAPQSIVSSAMTEVSDAGYTPASATPRGVTKCLISPATSLLNLNKRARECSAGDLRSETPKSCTPGFLLKKGLVKQTLGYNQRTPSGSHNRQMSPGIGHGESSTPKQPCKASNIEPHAVTTPLFRILGNQSSLADGQQQTHGPNRDTNLMTCASASRRDLPQTANVNKLTAKATSLATKNYPLHFNKPCSTPKGKINPFTPPLAISKKPTSPVTPPVACFNGGGVTPPLCNCGRRTRRRSVINPGPNQGRAFFTCSLNHGRSSLGSNADKAKSKSGCNFFRWEVHL